MSNYILYNGELYNADELKHYGVKGMKWGVRKSVYKSMNKQQRKETRKKYWESPEGKIRKTTIQGRLIGGLAGNVPGMVLGGAIGRNIGIKTVDGKGWNTPDKKVEKGGLTGAAVGFVSGGIPGYFVGKAVGKKIAYGNLTPKEKKFYDEMKSKPASDLSKNHVKKGKSAVDECKNYRVVDEQELKKFQEELKELEEMERLDQWFQ